MYAAAIEPSCSTSNVYFDQDRWIEMSRKCQYLPEGDMHALCELAARFLVDESNIVEVKVRRYALLCSFHMRSPRLL